MLYLCTTMCVQRKDIQNNENKTQVTDLAKNTDVQ